MKCRTALQSLCHVHRARSRWMCGFDLASVFVDKIKTFKSIDIFQGL
ncbi:hypothetical protein HMPREF9555_01811 [Selenomonas artemidis F0399]|uniref:Uncharacterized protein n=1 Tax=Selenomonas artemidis F0399 TaxID=749551 RepID=E7N470_9FIRM|nr:hypothetical protein HMPREF9555_01811 [Selenomonas artemidis F0399]